MLQEEINKKAKQKINKKFIYLKINLELKINK